jgi:hypothetical protein
MLVVSKKIVFLLVLINSFQNCFSQEKLAGNYIREGFEIGSHYLFNEDASFTQTKYLHLESQFVSTGTYKLVKDTLYLFYKPKLQKEKRYTFIKKRKIEAKKDKVYLFSKIKLIHKNRSTSGVSLLIYDKNRKALMGFDSDKNGEYPYLSLFDSKIGYFLFTSLHFQEVNIPASELFGYSSEVHINLNDSKIEYSQKRGAIKYLIKSFDKKKIELKNTKTKEKVILYKH